MNILMKALRKSCSGSITLETVLLMPIFIGILLFFLSVMQLAAARNLLEISVLKTADAFCKWAPLYRNDLLQKAQNEALGSFSDVLFGEMKESGDLLGQLVDLRSVSEKSLDLVYQFAAQTLCTTYINQDLLTEKGILHMKSVDFSRSSFFSSGTEKIRLTASCDVETYFPFPVKISFSVFCRAWGGGRLPYVYAGDDTETKGIWAENNFTRGKILRQMYGGNLPDQFPVIAAFENGTAISIKSLNHTAKTYQNPKAMEQAIMEMIHALAMFEGAEYGGVTVAKEQILRKKLILILPENECDRFQDAVLKAMMQYAMRELIELDLQRYQKV